MAKYLSQEWRENISASRKRHGHCSYGVTKVYRAWVAMKARCQDSGHHAYPDYGGRGISVCHRWCISFECFHKDMGDPPSDKHSLGRIDNAKGYSPSNCEWQTAKQQLRNTRANRMMTAFGETKTLMEWTEDPRCMSNYQSIWRRLFRGWGDERSITQPDRKMKNNHIEKAQ